MAVDKDGLKKEIIDKELEIIKAEIINSGKRKIAKKFPKAKFQNSLMITHLWINHGLWILNKQISNILKSNKVSENKNFRFFKMKVGEGLNDFEFNEKNYSSKWKSIKSFKRCIYFRTSRANPSMLEMIKVDVYGQLIPIEQLATISVPEARLISVSLG